MNGSRAKRLRRICFDQRLFDQNIEKLVAVEPDVKKAYIRGAQRKLYLRAKTFWARTRKADHPRLLADTVRAAGFVNETLLSRMLPNGG